LICKWRRINGLRNKDEDIKERSKYDLKNDKIQAIFSGLASGLCEEK
jgi:hypothetical protein